MATTKTTLNAEKLKTALWDTLCELRSGTMQPATADSIASQAREILRTGKLQAAVAKQTGKNVPTGLVDFCGISDQP